MPEYVSKPLFQIVCRPTDAPVAVFTKLASQLTASRLADLAIIPVIFIIQTLVSYLCAVVVSRCFSLKKRQQNFVIAMGVGSANDSSSPLMDCADQLQGFWEFKFASNLPDPITLSDSARSTLGQGAERQ
jgi:hypothetical protein